MAKKINLVIVEGISDRLALTPLTTYTASININTYIIIRHFDITSKNYSKPQNIKALLGKFIKEEFAKLGVPIDKISEIWMLTDMDGAYIDEHHIKEVPGLKKFVYCDDYIAADNKSAVIKRNKLKTQNLNTLIKTKILLKKPFKIFFMSCNLDHVTVNKQNLSPEKKLNEAIKFINEYNEFAKFREFFRERLTESGIPDNYLLSWEHIKQETHSLKRGSNFIIGLDELNVKS